MNTNNTKKIPKALKENRPKGIHRFLMGIFMPDLLEIRDDLEDMKQDLRNRL